MAPQHCERMPRIANSHVHIFLAVMVVLVTQILTLIITWKIQSSYSARSQIGYVVHIMYIVQIRFVTTDDTNLKFGVQFRTSSPPINDQLFKYESADSSFLDESKRAKNVAEVKRSEVAPKVKDPISHNDHCHKSQHNSQVENCQHADLNYLFGQATKQERKGH